MLLQGKKKSIFIHGRVLGKAIVEGHEFHCTLKILMLAIPSDTATFPGELYRRKTVSFQISDDLAPPLDFLFRNREDLSGDALVLLG